MKTITYIILAYIVTIIIVCALDYKQSIEIEVLEARIELLELKLTTFKADMREYKVEIDYKTRPYTYIIPVSGGFLGVRGEKTE